MKKHILFLFMLFCTLAFADTATDSLETLIRSGKGIRRIEARLEKAFRARISNFQITKKEVQEALKEIQKLNDPGELEARAYYYLGSAYYYNSQPDSAWHYFRLAEEIALKNNYYRILGNVYQLTGALYNSYYGDPVRAIEFYNKSIHFSLLADNPRALGAVYSDLSSLLCSNGAYEKALEYIFKARDSYRKADFREGEAWVLYLIGMLYDNTGLYEEALDSYQESLAIYYELAQKDGIMGGVAICLDQLASVSLKMKDIHRAREYNREALELHRQGDSKHGLSTSLKYLADIEYADGNYDEALQVLDSALNIKKVINNVAGFASVYELYGMIFSAKKEYGRALDSLKIGREYAERNNQLRHMADISGHLSTIHYHLGNYHEAYNLKSRQVAISDSIYSIATPRKLLQSEELLQIESQEKQIRELEQENRLRELSLTREAVIRRYLTGIIILSLIILGMFIYMYFMTRKANRELLESKKRVDSLNATKDKFFSIIAHDLRSPLSSILGLSSLLLQRQHSLNPDDREKLLAAINESAQNSFRLLDSLLEWARTQSGAISFDPQHISLKESVEEVIRLLTPQANEKNITLEFHADDFLLHADKNMLHTILRNLISNAIKYSYSGDKVSIGAKEKEDRIWISIQDSGIGIPETAQKELFSVSDSYRIAGTAGEKGSGLGLMICKEFVEKHSGHIGLESVQGQGTTFYFTIKKAE